MSLIIPRVGWSVEHSNESGPHLKKFEKRWCMAFQIFNFFLPHFRLISLDLMAQIIHRGDAHICGHTNTELNVQVKYYSFSAN